MYKTDKIFLIFILPDIFVPKIFIAMTLNVMKFGGTSVGSAERIKNVLKLVDDNKPTIVVLSAMSGTTDKLVEINKLINNKDSEGAREIISLLEKKYYGVVDELYSSEDALKNGKKLIKEHFENIRKYLSLNSFSEKEEKEILAEGELISTHLFYYLCQELAKDAALIPALEFMRIDEYDEPVLNYIRENIKPWIEKNKGSEIFITQGYICRNSKGNVDNLKRGGSDYTATLIGAAIRANEVQIWTDIDGVHNNDPRFVENTKPITHLSFDEAAELAYFGAKILHPTCVLPCIRENIPVRLKNTMDPKAFGTLISNQSSGSGIKAIAAKDGIIAIKIKSTRMLLAYGFLRKIFEIFEKYRTPIDMITTSEVSVSLTIDNSKYLNEIVDELSHFSSVEVDKDQTIVCIVGDFISDNKGMSVQIFKALENIPIRMISYGGSHHNISLLINTLNKKEALQSLSKHIFN